MKNLTKPLFLFWILALTACQTDETISTLSQGEGEVSFSFDISTNTNSRTNARSVNETPDKIVVTITNAIGETVYDLTELNVIAFNGNYISDPIALEVGAYQLTEYFVIDDTGATIYTTPLEGSELAYLVNDPLSIDFGIVKDGSDQITPEVLSTEDIPASDFGYVDFDFDIVETFDFLMSVHVFDTASESYELTDAQVVISGDGTGVYNEPITAETDQIRLPDGHTQYEIITSKSGYISDTVVLDVDGLKAHLEDPLVVVLSPLVTVTEYFDVYANGNSVSGGTGLSVGTFSPGETISITSSEEDTWYWVAGSSFTNANGASGGPWSIFGFEFQLLSLVGSIDGGNNYFMVGTSYETTIDSSTPVELTLYAWDVDKDNNSGFITVTVTH